MTENEAIKAITLEGLNVGGSARRMTEFCKGLAVAEEALTEIQQYRAIGTVEEIKYLKEKNEPRQKPSREELLAELQELSRMKMMLKCYQSIGTVDECRAAVERMRPKEAIMHNNPIEGADDLPVCPNCNTIMVRTEIFGRTIDEHCVSCGQAIDWGE